MPTIKASDKITLEHSSDDIWKVLIDIPSYYKWWPSQVKIEVYDYSNDIVGTIFVVRPLGGQSFSCRIKSIEENKEIRLEYYDGLYRGVGFWNLESYNSATVVSYTVDLEIFNKFVVALSYILPISKIHSWVFKNIFNGLKRYLNSRQ
jgi:ribosome-associated toxin RatA of RatAB toxin-antitoxin module